jgi:hypothetical protein
MGQKPPSGIVWRLSWLIVSFHLYEHRDAATECRKPGIDKGVPLKWLAHLSLMKEEYFDVQASNASDDTPDNVLGPVRLGPCLVESVVDRHQSQ